MTNCNGSEQDQEKRKAKLVAVPEGGLWDCEQVAAYLSVSKSWVWKQCRENLGLPFVELGRRNYRFIPEKVRAWVEANTQQQGRVG